MPVSLEDRLFATLPESRPPWKEFIFSLAAEASLFTVLFSVVLSQPNLFEPPARDYHFVQLVNTPVPSNHEPAPVRVFQRPAIARLEAADPDKLRLPAEPPKPKPDEPAPKVQVSSNQAPPLAPSAPVIPRELVRTNVFSTGSSAVPTMARAPQQVQTGGFGDPNGVPAQLSNGRPVTIAQSGSFDLPVGPGKGNGTGGTHGNPGVVASTGFGSGIATGDGSGRVSASRGGVRESGFGDTEVAATPANRAKREEAAPKIVPAEILFKPTPAYTDEARKLRVEGEVLLEVVLHASGQLQVLRVVRGLGHGLDENAIRAAEQIRFKPSLRDGQPADSTAVLHIIFQLA